MSSQVWVMCALHTHYAKCISQGEPTKCLLVNFIELHFGQKCFMSAMITMNEVMSKN